MATEFDNACCIDDVLLTVRMHGDATGERLVLIHGVNTGRHSVESTPH